MREDIARPRLDSRPLVGSVESLDPSGAGTNDRDEAIIQLLREKLKGRGHGDPALKPRRRASDKAPQGEGEDKYEPQRLSRKICWQYDSSARKVPLLRRPYI
jgi:hypothetical protein